MEKESFKKFGSLTTLCRKIIEEPRDLKLLEELKRMIQEAPQTFIRAAEKPLIMSFLPFMQNRVQNPSNTKENGISEKGKLLIIETLNELLDKLIIDKCNQFFNFYTFLLLELYNYKDHKVLPSTEEYKLAILKCMTSLINSVSPDILEELYVKENVPKFSQIVYVCSQIAEDDVARNIRISAITCIMAMARVSNPEDISDTVIQRDIANVFMFFLPGLQRTLPKIALEDPKVGHVIPMMSIRALGRIINLVMQDFNSADEKFNYNEKLLLKDYKNISLVGKLNSKKEIDQYMQNTIRNSHWYKDTDEKLNISLKKLGKLTFHRHLKVRLEMADMVITIIKNCVTTMPQSSCTLIEHLIILSQDADAKVATKSINAIQDLSKSLSADHLKALLETLEDGFYNAINSLPRKLNTIDEAEKIATLNLLIGYIKLFGKHNMINVLISPDMLKSLVDGLLHIVELERKNISLLEEYTFKDLSSEATFKCPWINFHYFEDFKGKNQIDILCQELVKNNCFQMIYESLTPLILYNSECKKEAVYLLNSHILGLKDMQNTHLPILKSIIKAYTEDPLNDLNTSLDTEEFTLEEIQANVITICLLTEGIGNISIVLKDKFKPCLLETLYMVLEKAGSGHPLISVAGLLTLHNLVKSCGYKDEADLLNSNFDFFSFHVQKKLTKPDDKDGVLNVLSVVLQYSNVDVLIPMKNLTEEVLVISCDRFKEQYATAYLRVFKMFIMSLRRWFIVDDYSEKTIKSRKEKELEQEHYKVSGFDESNDFSDDIMGGKSAEEMYKEDMEKIEQDCDVMEEKEKPTPPMHVQLTTLILTRSLHFLPSKIQSRKFLVLEILEKGIEILRDWEDELLPVIHQIWSPLMPRFSEDSDAITMRLSIQLVATMARLSKDFIHRRFIQELLPRLKDILEKSAQTSYLKDKGSTYRYSQNYKLQVELLSKIGPILYDVDVMPETISDVIDKVQFYLSDKQPKELQAAAVGFFKMMLIYDMNAVKTKIITIQSLSVEYIKNIERIQKYMEETTDIN
ncbi:unnamed protein product [Ceutorhynchus assimilis]|uniref:TELO2-interacting protein 1 homolog n=1 Tax=Ceutorhynchus assimilis TaxID=467358 RepID=A0A9N9MVE5_9CUCU|nr:unnamed protein product [Ceutorhynchus assimilis]